VSERFPTDSVPDRPEFEVRVDGAALEPLQQRDVIEVDVSEEVSRHARLTLLVQNWIADESKVRHSDDGPFAPGKGIEVFLGYHSSLEQVFDGVITSLTTHFPSTSSPTLRVEARSRSVLLSYPARSRLFEEATDGDVVSALASDYGLQADSEAGITQPFVVVDGRSDWDYLVDRARELGWVTYVRGESVVFRPPASPEGDLPELSWGTNLTELHLTQDVTRVAASVTATTWDPETLELESADADESRSGIQTGSRPGHGSAVDDTGWPLRARLLDTPAALGTDEIDRLAAGSTTLDALAHISGAGATVGVPKLRADSWMDVEGVGDRFGGQLYVSAVRHRLSARGYVTEFQLGLPRPLRPPAEADGGELRLGVVEDLDDPLGWGRVKVGFPWRTDATESIWARIATLDAGDKMGTWFVPDVGQEVVVSFLDGDPRHPIVLGSLWNGTQAPPETMDPDKNAIRSIVSRSGHFIRLDDGDDAKIEISTVDGRTVVLSDGDSSLELKEPGGNHIKISGDGIELVAKSGDVKITASAGSVEIDAAKLQGKSSGPAKLESSATFDLKASATLGLRGALVNIN
jgi:uncharacterized protein involved in type VI secretion and phage assembly